MRALFPTDLFATPSFLLCHLLLRKLTSENPFRNSSLVDKMRQVAGFPPRMETLHSEYLPVLYSS